MKAKAYKELRPTESEAQPEYAFAGYRISSRILQKPRKANTGIPERVF